MNLDIKKKDEVIFHLTEETTENIEKIQYKLNNDYKIKSYTLTKYDIYLNFYECYKISLFDLKNYIDFFKSFYKY